MKKKLFILGLITLTTFALFGCQQGPVSSSSTNQTQSDPRGSLAVVNNKDSTEQTNNAMLGLIMRMDKMMTIGKNHITSLMAGDITVANGLKVSSKGELTFPADKMIPKNDETRNLTHMSTEDLVTMDGTILWSNGMVTLPSGVTIQAGTVYLKDGSQILNSVQLPDQTTSISDDGTAIVNGQTVSFKDQAGTLKDGTKVSFDGKVTTVTLPDGTVVTVGKSTKLPDGTMISYDTGVITRVDGVTFDPEIGLKLKDGTVVAGANTVTLNK